MEMIGMRQLMIKFLFTLLVALSTVTLAAGFTVDITAIDDTILPLESATYELIIANPSGVDDVIKLSSDNNDWIITPQAISLQGNKTNILDLYITPRSGVGLSNYRIPIYFESSKTDTIVEESIFLSLGLDLLTKGYPPNVRLNVTAASTIDPRNPYEVGVFLRNYNLREYENLTISVNSEVFSETIKAPLQPMATYRKTFSFNLDKYLLPQNHELNVAVALDDGTVIAQDIMSFEIKGHASLAATNDVISKKFLRKVEIINATNDGNKELTKPVMYKVSAWEDMFLTANPKGEVIKKESSDGKTTRWLVWTPRLAPQETMIITIKKNYIPLAAVILAIILAIIAYFTFRSPIISIKEMQVIAADEQGIQEMKVRVFVKNRSRGVVNKLKIIDRVPHFAEFVTSNHLGTLQPTKVTKSEKRGTIVRWEIESLEPYEERIISYKVKSKLKIVGRMNLPETRIKFEKVKGHARVVASSPARLVK